MRALPLVLVPTLVWSAVSTTPTRAVDPHVRSSVQAFDAAVYATSVGIPVNWTGSVDTGSVGTQNQDFRNAGILRINYYRNLVGLPNVGEDASASAKCAQAALMMHANGALSHSPPTSWTWYTADGAEAAGKSNLAMHSRMASGTAIDQYIDDSGTSNGAVGHRRWILYPPLTNVGHGDTTTYNVLWVIENSSHPTISGDRPAQPTFIAWPPAAYLPVGRMPSSQRWSYSIYRADFSSATVTVHDNSGTAQGITAESNATGYGDNTLVWRTTGVTTSVSGATEIPYHVLIRGVRNGTGRSAVSYSVLLMDTTATRTDEARPVASVSATTATAIEGGQVGVFTVNLASPAERETFVNYALAGSAGTTDFTPSGVLRIASGASSGTLTITAVDDGTGEANETVAITLDPGAGYTLGTTTTASLTLVEPSPNTAPSISGPANQSLGAGSSVTGLAITLSDTETALASLTLTAVSSDTRVLPASGLVLGGSDGARTLDLTPTSAGTATVTLRVTDGGGLTASTSFTVTVTGSSSSSTTPESGGNSGCGLGGGLALAGLGLLFGQRRRQSRSLPRIAVRN